MIFYPIYNLIVCVCVCVGSSFTYISIIVSRTELISSVIYGKEEKDIKEKH